MFLNRYDEKNFLFYPLTNHSIYGNISLQDKTKTPREVKRDERLRIL